MPEKGINTGLENKSHKELMDVSELQRLSHPQEETTFEVNLNDTAKNPGDVSFDVPLDAHIPTLQPVEIPKADFSKLELDHDFNKMDAEAHALADKMPPPDWSKLEPLDYDFNTLETERTPAESRNVLRTLVEKITALTGVTTEKIGSTLEKSKAYLTQRSAEIDAEVGRTGKVEQYFRALGEKYNKLGWKSKLAVGASLGLGAAAFSTVSVPTALLFMGGLGAQRVAGMASVFLKAEKSLQSKDSSGLLAKKEKAMLKAMLYTAGMGAAIKEGVELASESSWGEATHEWLRQHYPFGSAEVSPERNVVGGDIVRPEVHGLVAAEMPTVSASAGHGYEFMAKRLWEELQTKGLHPEDYKAGSDIRRLLEADAGSIDTVVHEIAADPSHHFFNPDGTSVIIDPDAQMTIDVNGQIHVSDSINAVKAPEGAPVTPAYSHPEIVTTPAAPEVSVAPEAHVAAIAAPEVTETPVAPMPAETIATPIHPVEISGTELPPTDVPLPSHEIITNHLGLKVPVAEAHLYAGPPETGNIFIYGGSAEEQMKIIQAYLVSHPDSVVYGADTSGDYRVPYYIRDGQVAAGPKLRADGFLSIFSLEKAPGPEDFQTRIK
jgi:hypothetical protein